MQSRFLLSIQEGTVHFLDPVQKTSFLVEMWNSEAWNSKVCMNQSLRPSIKLILRENAVLQMWFLDSQSQSRLIFTSPRSNSSPSCSSLSSSKEDNKDDEEDDEDQKDLDHQPAVGGDGLEVFEDLHVCSVHIQLGVLHVSIDPRTEWDSKFNPFQLLLINVLGSQR